MNRITTLKFNLLFLLVALPLGMNAQVFSDGFESGTYLPIWTTESGTYTRVVDAISPAIGTYSFHITGGTGTSHLNGISKTFVASQPSEVSYRVKGALTGSNGYVVMGSASLTSNTNQMVFSRFQATGNLNFYAGATEYDFPVSSNTWYHVELKNIDWTNKEFDIYIDGALQYTNFPFRDQSINNIANVHFYNYHSATASLDDMNIGPVASCSTPPTAICQNITVYLDATGSYTIAGLDFDGGSIDNCSTAGLTFSASQSTFTCSDVGTPVTVDLTVLDGSANSAVCAATITVTDFISPTASVPTPIMVQCIEDVPAADPLVFTDEADNCGVPTVAFVSEVSDGLTCPETITRTYSITDDSGNSIDVNHLIIVQDDIPPVPNGGTSTVNSFCDVTLTPPPGTDNCDGVTTPVADVTFPITALGTTTVTWTHTDICGNTSTEMQDVVISTIDVSTTQMELTLSSNNTNATDYQWINCSNNQSITGETSIDFTATANGDYAVIITEDGCSDTSACITIDIIGIEDIDINNLTLYPNPTVNGNFTVSANTLIKSIELIDMLGRKVQVHSLDLNKGVVDASNLTSGKYIVQIVTINDELLKGSIVIK